MESSLWNKRIIGQPYQTYLNDTHLKSLQRDLVILDFDKVVSSVGITVGRRHSNMKQGKVLGLEPVETHLEMGKR